MTEKIIESIKAVKHFFPKARFIVFGSEARNETNEFSDVDICVLFPSEIDDEFALAAIISSKLRQFLDRPLDIIVLDIDTFETRAKENWTLEYVISHEGIAV